MKKLFVLFSSLLIVFNSFAYDPVKIDEQLLQTFAVQFPNAQDVAWQELNDSYVVSFIEGDIRLKIVYFKNGDIVHLLRYYMEKNLPLDIRLDLKKKYPGKKIYGVTEENIVSNHENKSKTVYFIKLEDEGSWFTIKAQRHKKFKTIEKLNKDI